MKSLLNELSLRQRVLADWSSILAGFGIVGGALLLYGISLFMRLRQAEGHGNGGHGGS